MGGGANTKNTIMKIEVNGKKFIEADWLSNPTGFIGVIKTEDVTTKKRQVYIGIAEGISEEMDIKRIINYGTVVTKTKQLWKQQKY